MRVGRDLEEKSYLRQEFPVSAAVRKSPAERRFFSPLIIGHLQDRAILGPLAFALQCEWRQ
jgi:hypothetical protein